jgi:hypothetical protein
MREKRGARFSKLPDGNARNELTGVRWIDVVFIILNYVADIHRESGRKRRRWALRQDAALDLLLLEGRQLAFARLAGRRVFLCVIRLTVLFNTPARLLL